MCSQPGAAHFQCALHLVIHDFSRISYSCFEISYYLHLSLIGFLSDDDFNLGNYLAQGGLISRSKPLLWTDVLVMRVGNNFRVMRCIIVAEDHLPLGKVGI